MCDDNAQVDDLRKMIDILIYVIKDYDGLEHEMMSDHGWIGDQPLLTEPRPYDEICWKDSYFDENGDVVLQLKQPRKPTPHYK